MIHIDNVVLGAKAKPGLATPKYDLHIHSFKMGVSHVKAIQVFAQLTGMTLQQAKWFLAQLPQFLAVPAPEHFQQIIMDEAEARETVQILEPHFELSVAQAGKHVLGFGMVVTAPWAVKDGEQFTEEPT